jgi:hypothetical protein
MKLNVYSIFDSAAKAYTNPFFMHNDGLAIRAFSDNVNSEQENNISKHPDQFTLFRIGEFDDSSGEIKTDIVKSLGTGLQYQEKTGLDESQAALIINLLKELKEEK